MPGMPSPNAFDLVRESCAAVMGASKSVSIQPEAVSKLAAELAAAPERVHNAARGLMFPIKFDDVQAEVTFLALYHLLDFGSGYGPLLLLRCRRDAHETLQYGVIGMHLSGVTLDVTWMKAFSSMSVQNFFGFDATDDVMVMPGITMSRPGVLHPLSQALQRAINETGRALDALGHRTLGRYILALLDMRKAAGLPSTADALVDGLTAAFPAFRDDVTVPAAAAPAQAGDGTGTSSTAGDAVTMDEDTPQTTAAGAAAAADGAGATASTEGRAAEPCSTSQQQQEQQQQPLHFLRRAQNLAATLANRFGAEDGRFAFDDLAKLTADSGPSVSAVLHHYGVLQYSPELKASIERQEVLVPGSEAEVSLRASTVAAADAVVAAAGNAFTAHELSAYLTFLLEPSRELHSAVKKIHLTRGTTAY